MFGLPFGSPFSGAAGSTSQIGRYKWVAGYYDGNSYEAETVDTIGWDEADKAAPIGWAAEGDISPIGWEAADDPQPKDWANEEYVG